MKNIKPYTTRNELLDRLLSSFDYFPEMTSATLENTNWVPKIDVKESDKEYTVLAEVPGISPDKIDVTVDNGVLTIKGQKESEKKEEKENYLRVERSTGSFIRQMTLPDSIDTDHVRAKENHGVLEIILPKADKRSSKKISISK